MDIKTVKQLAGILRDYGLTELSVTQGDLNVKLTKDSSTEPLSVPRDAEPRAGIARKDQETQADGLDFNKIHTVTSPMVGVFYQASGPGEAPFVQTGSKVKAGDVLCIIEAMKLMNEITAAKDGEIVDICVSDGDVVEFGQTLFKIF